MEHGVAPATKAAVESRDVAVEATVRPPLVELDERSRDNVAATVADIVAEYD